MSDNINSGYAVSTFPLTMAQEGENVRIVFIRGGSKSEAKYLSMGIKVDEIIRVVNCQANGGKVIETSNGRFALGVDPTHRIMVSSAA